MTKAKQQTLTFFTTEQSGQEPEDMTYYAARTKTHSFTIWFCRGGVEYNMGRKTDVEYSYDSKYALPIHHMIIKHFGIADAVKKWNESHS